MRIPSSVAYLAWAALLVLHAGGEVLFTATLDKPLAGRDALGETVRAAVTGVTTSAPGIRGECTILERGATCEFAADAVLHPQAGSLEIWVAPGDWTGYDASSFTLVSAEPLRLSKQGQRLVASVGRTRLDCLIYDWVTPDFFRRNVRWSGTDAQGHPQDSGRYAWHHVVLTWDVAEMRLMVDGQIRATARCHAGTPWPGNRILLGDPNSPTRTLLDELSIFGQPLRADEALSRCMAYLARKPAYPRPTISVSRTPRPPLIDGNLDDPAWNQAAATAGFVVHTTGRLFPVPTRVYLTYDDERLYVGYRTQSAGRWKAEASYRDDPRNVGDDNFEMLIENDRYHWTADYFHFIGSASGSFFDTRAGARDQNDFNAEWQYRCIRTDGQWTGEIAMDWRQLGVKGAPAAGARWGLQLARAAPSLNAAPNSCWAKASVFANVETFGHLILGGDAPFVRLDEMAAPTRDGYRARGELVNPSATRRTLVVQLHVYGESDFLPAKSASLGPVVLAAGARRPWGLEVAAADGRGQVELQVTETETGRTLYRQMVGVPGLPLPAPVAEQGPSVANDTPASDPPAKTAEKNAAPEADLQEPEWWDNTLGMSDRVLPPWTPLVVTGNTVCCWGREYDFANALLLAQATSGGKPLLAGPPRLAGRINGQPFQVSLASVTVEAAASNVVRLASAATAAGLRFTAKTRIEYDGVVWTDLTLSPVAGPVTLEELTLTVPYRREHAVLFAHEKGGHDEPDNGGVLGRTRWVCPLRKYFWLGDDDRGFMWWIESTIPYGLKDPDRGMTISPGRSQTTMEIRFVDVPETIEAPRRFAFGFEATPVRPLPSDWRAASYTWFAGYNYGWDDGFANPIPKDPEAFRKQREEGLASGRYGFPPFEPSLFPVTDSRGKVLPLETQYGDAWRPKPRQDDQICGRTQWVNYWMWCFNRLVVESRLNTAYFDGLLMFCDRPEHGCTEPGPDGRPVQRQAGNWSAQREFLRRVQTILKAQPYPTLIQSGSYWGPFPPRHGWFESFCDGEQYNRGRIAVKDDYTKVLPLETLRALYTPAKFGVVPFFLPQIHAHMGWDVPRWPTETLYGLMMIHDVLVCSSYNHWSVGNEINAALKTFGMEDVDFWPYWSNGRVVRPADAQVKVSVFPKRDRSRFLVVVMNLGETDRIAGLRVHLSRLGLKTPAVTDLRTEERLSVQAETWFVPVRGKNFRMLDVRNGAGAPTG